MNEHNRSFPKKEKGYYDEYKSKKSLKEDKDFDYTSIGVVDDLNDPKRIKEEKCTSLSSSSKEISTIEDDSNEQSNESEKVIKLNVDKEERQRGKNKSVLEFDYESTGEMMTILEKLVDSKTPRGGFKFTSMRLLITYCKVKIDKESLLTKITQLMKRKTRTIEEYIIIHETQDNIEYTHIYIKLNVSLSSNNANIFNYENMRPNIERVRQYPIEIENVKLYLFNKDPDPYTNINKPAYQPDGTIRRRKTIEDTTIDVNNINESNVDTNFEPKPWQQYILNVIKGEPDRRAIYWCYDLIGNTGKTRLANYISNRNEDVVIINSFGTCDELISAYINARKTNRIQILIFDLSRELIDNISSGKITFLFDFIGKIKDRIVTSQMTVQPNPCHIIIFANCIPFIKKLSPDRWNIIRILKDGNAYIDHVNEEGEIEQGSSYISTSKYVEQC